MFENPSTGPDRRSPADVEPPTDTTAAAPVPTEPDDKVRLGWATWLDYHLSTRVRSVLAVAVIVLATVVSDVGVAQAAEPAVLAVDSLDQVVNNLRVWLLAILASLATLFLVIGAVRYLVAGGDPSEVEKAKVALKSAAIGYCLALLAPVLVSLLGKLVG
jgi:hypothetical protein